MVFGETFFRYLAFPKPDPNYDIYQFDLDRDVKLDGIHLILTPPTPPFALSKARRQDPDVLRLGRPRA
jgi:hypothetical protein